MYKVITKCPIALDSPDHWFPRGVKNEHGGPRYTWKDGYNPFLDEVKEYFLEKGVDKPKLLDLGCAMGNFVQEGIERGFDSVGLEGSDAALRSGGKNWVNLLGKQLFLCDISRDFDIMDEDGERVKFDIITAWEVVEHIYPDRQKILAENVFKHLKDDGIYVMSVAPFKNGRVLGKYDPKKHRKPNLHMSWKLQKGDYEDIYNKFDFVGSVRGENEEFYHYIFNSRYRGHRKIHKNSFWSTLQIKDKYKSLK